LQSTWAEANQSCKAHLGEFGYLAAFENLEEWNRAKKQVEDYGMRKDIIFVYV